MLGCIISNYGTQAILAPRPLVSSRNTLLGLTLRESYAWVAPILPASGSFSSFVSKTTIMPAPLAFATAIDARPIGPALDLTDSLPSLVEALKYLLRLPGISDLKHFRYTSFKGCGQAFICF